MIISFLLNCMHHKKNTFWNRMHLFKEHKPKRQKWKASENGKKKKNPEWFQGNCVSWLQIFNCILVQTDSSSLFERLCGRLQSGHHLYPKLSAYHCHCRWLGIIQFLNIIFSWLCPYCSGVLLLCCSLRCPALIAAPFCQCQSTESAGASVNCGCWSSSYPEFPHFLHWTSLIASAVIAVFHVVSGLAHISPVSPISMIDLTWLTCSEVV